MRKVQKDITQRQYIETYNTLHAAPYLREFANQGSVEAITTVIDLENSISKACLTDRHKTVLHWFFDMGYTQQEIADTLQITQQGVQCHVKGAVNKIAAVLGDGDYVYTEEKTVVVKRKSGRP